MDPLANLPMALITLVAPLIVGAAAMHAAISRFRKGGFSFLALFLLILGIGLIVGALELWSPALFGWLR